MKTYDSDKKSRLECGWKVVRDLESRDGIEDCIIFLNKNNQSMSFFMTQQAIMRESLIVLNLNLTLMNVLSYHQFRINNMLQFQSTGIFLPHQSKSTRREESSESTSTFQEAEKTPVSRFISKEIKTKFIDLITNRNYSMKEAAKMVSMSYSTAKKIYRRFRTANMAKSNSKRNECRIQASYRQVGEDSGVRIMVTCLIAGNFQKSDQFQ